MVEPRLSRELVSEYLSRLPSRRVCVVGDVMLDRYFWGVVRRISPEAPVPVVKITGRSGRLGGAANVAANLRELGVGVMLVGVTGADEAGSKLRSLLEERGISQASVLEDSSRPTTEKTRIVAQGQQVVRTDFELDQPLCDELAARVLEAVSGCVGSADALVVSDYGKGVVSEKLLGESIALWRGGGKPVLIDPHVAHFHWYKGATVVTPNFAEAAAFFGASPNGARPLEEIGSGLRDALELDALLITRGEEGMNLFTSRGEHIQVPTVAEEVYDVTGAGDTVISVLAACLAAGVELLHAVCIANRAAGEAVREVGTATVRPAKIIASFA